jgi:hypothetical protein
MHFRPGKPGADLNGAWIQTVVNSLVQNEAEKLARVIQDTARKLSEALDTAARATSTGERGEGFPWAGFVKELPVPDSPRCSIQLQKPRLLALSADLSRRSVRLKLESGCGVLLTGFFDSYGRALELWFRGVLIHLEREFNGTADVYRTHMQRLSETSANIAVDQNILLEDISALEQKLELSDVLDRSESHAMA